MVINTTEGEKAIRDSYSLRRQALVSSVPYFTTVAAATAAVAAIEATHARPDGGALAAGVSRARPNVPRSRRQKAKGKHAPCSARPCAKWLASSSREAVRVVEPARHPVDRRLRDVWLPKRARVLWSRSCAFACTALMNASQRLSRCGRAAR